MAAGLFGFALVATGCGDAVGGKHDAAGDGVLVIGANAGSSNQFPENFNVNGGGDSAPGVALFYETLFRVSAVDGGQLLPNLALDVEHEDEGYTAIYHLREGVKWSDGEPFTAEDVAFSYNVVFGAPGPDESLAEAVYAEDDLTVVMKANFPLYQQDTNMSLYYPIYPKHIYGEQEDPTKYVDQNPVGTGPGILEEFSGQRIVIGIRDDYWGGESKGVKKVQIIPSGTAGNIYSQITQGGVDWSESAFPGVQTEFVQRAEDNKYEYFADGSSRGVVFMTTKAPFDDPAVRKALRDSVDLEPATEATGVGYGIPTAAGLSPTFFNGLLLSGYEDSIKPDVEGAKKTLEDAGWSIEDGKLVKDGESYALKLWVNLDQGLDVVVSPMICEQWKSNLGLDVEYSPTSDTIFQADYKGYDMFLWNTNLSGSPYNAFQAYSWRNLEEDRQEMDYGNRGLWKAPEVFQNGLTELQKTSPTDIDLIRPTFESMQEAVVEDAPYLGVIEGGQGVMWTVKNWTGWPKSGESDYRPQVTQLNNFPMTVMNLEPAK